MPNQQQPNMDHRYLEYLIAEFTTASDEEKPGLFDKIIAVMWASMIRRKNLIVPVAFAENEDGTKDKSKFSYKLIKNEKTDHHAFAVFTSMDEAKKSGQLEMVARPAGDIVIDGLKVTNMDGFMVNMHGYQFFLAGKVADLMVKSAIGLLAAKTLTKNDKTARALRFRNTVVVMQGSDYALDEQPDCPEEAKKERNVLIEHGYITGGKLNTDIVFPSLEIAASALTGSATEESDWI